VLGHLVQVWAIPPEGMQCDWLGERVATVDVTRAITNVLHNKEDAGWGPNAVFRFPLEGGTGGIWKAVAAKLPQDRLVRSSTTRPLHTSAEACPTGGMWNAVSAGLLPCRVVCSHMHLA
jgi:hypothetical protein